MTLLEDARRLAEKNPHDAGWACFSCGMSGGRNSGFGDMHHADCPWLALPKIVAAMEAAERMAEAHFLGEPTEEYGSERIYVLCGGDGLTKTHRDGCQWQTLVAALKDEG